MTSAMRDLLHGITHRTNDRTADSLIDSEGSRSLSRHSSIQGPYREGMNLKDTNFPLYRTIDIPIQTGEIYARSLLSLGNGVGLHHVRGNLARPKIHFEHGAFIGDVGSISESGSFSYCFNIFCPQTHPINNRGDLPQGFTPFEPELSVDDTVTSTVFEPGTILRSEGITVSRIPNSTSQVEFNTSAREGAILVLPTGASREELADPSKIFFYVKEHAASWYQFYNGNSNRVASILPAANGTLWVVTGVDRVKSWSTATFPVQKSDVGKHRQFFFNGDNPLSPWDENRGLNTAFFDTQYLTDGTQGAIFLRVMAVALSPFEWARHVAYIPPEIVGCYAALPGPVVGREARGHYSMPRLSRLLRRKSLLFPEVIFHPSIPLLHILILTDPTAQVAIVPDSVWISQLSKVKRHLTHPEIVALTRRVIDNFDIVNKDGIVTFVSKEEKDGEQKITDPNPQGLRHVWFFHQILSWLTKSQDKSPRSRALQNMSKVLSLS